MVCFLCCSCVCDAPVCQLPVDIVFYCFGFNFTGKQAKKLAPVELVFDSASMFLILVWHVIERAAVISFAS